MQPQLTPYTGIFAAREVNILKNPKSDTGGDVKCRCYLGARLKKLVNALATSSGICQKKKESNFTKHPKGLSQDPIEAHISDD